MKIRLKFLRTLVVIALCFGTFVLPTTSFAWDASSAYDCGKGGDFPMTFAGCRAGYYYEDWENADTSLGPDEIGECLECPDGYVCYGGFAAPQSPSSCAPGYYGATIESCTPCTNKPANSTYTGAAETNSCSWTCDSGYTKVGSSCIIPYEYDADGSMYDCNVGHFPMAFAGCRAGYYYEDWENADASLLPDEIGECLECPDGYVCYGGFAGPQSPSPCATGYYGATIESCTPCTNKPAHSTYTGAAAINSCPWECDSGYNENSGTCSVCTANQITINGTCQTAKFTVTTTNNTDEFGFYLSAAGTFYIDWGDGTIETIDRTNDTDYTKYEHQYASAKKYTVRFGGTATDYNTDGYPTITFNEEYACFDECESNWAQNIASITGDLGEIFGAAQSGNIPKFNNTFATAPITSIPSGLFASIDTSSATDTNNMFDGTFVEARNLAAIPSGLFDSIDTSNATNTSFMFLDTFAGCTSLTGIPSDLFAGIDTSSATNTSYMFNNTFSGCTRLTSIPADLFSGIDTSSATKTNYMFYLTFSDCTRLTSIPAGLFAGIDTSSARNTSYMFSYTFSGCTGLTSIPAGLFSDIDTSSATNTSNMFYSTFSNCTGLTSIPAGLFSGITVPNAKNKESMFSLTFSGCSNITGYIPPSTFAGLIENGSPTADYMWSNTFYGTHLATTCPTGTTEITTGYKGANNSPYTKWGNYVSCEIDYPFTLTTTSTDSFQFKLSAAGTFYVDCGTGGTLSGTGVSGNVITRSNVSATTYTCGYSDSAIRTIRFGGTATGYSTTNSTAAISFYTSQANTQKITGISGSLGQIFPVATNGNIPRFFETFYYASNMTSVPSGLFSGISSATNTSYMFFRTFYNCSSLTSIPAGLFSGIDTSSATNTRYMFLQTFSNCSGLTSIPAGLFSGIDTSSATNTNDMFSSTFSSCTGLTSIPADLFAGIDTSSATDTASMFSTTFYGCNKLTSIPADLFSGIDTSSATKTSSMFSSTFAYCNKLTSVPAGLFSGIDTSSATNTASMFYSTFFGCSGLTSIPSGLFSGIDTSSATNTASMFSTTFSSCRGLTSIPAGLFSSIDTSSATNTSAMFAGTFAGWTGLTSIPSDLFAGIDTSSATNTASMFGSTFYGCTGLTSIPAGLFSSITVPNATDTSYMFQNTFFGCSGLTSIPSDLFSGIDTSSATNTASMFNATFAYCNKLTSVPTGLFSGIDTSSATDTNCMFQNTFYNCSSLTSIPADLFSGIDTSSATNTRYMFGNTFSNCTGLTSIPAGLFSGITVPNATDTSYMFQNTFSGCSNITGYIPPSTFEGLIASGSPTASDMWDNTFNSTQLAQNSCPSGTTEYPTGYKNVTDGWGAYVSCIEDASHTCSAGQYLPKLYNSCETCPAGSYCAGGTYGFNENSDQGIQSCASGTYAPTGSTVCYQHILHVGNDNVYLRSTKQTTPSLNIQIGNDIFYANMTMTPSYMNKDSSHYLHILYEGDDYYVCDDTTYVAPSE